MHLDDIDAEPHRTVAIRLSDSERAAIVMGFKQLYQADAQGKTKKNEEERRNRMQSGHPSNVGDLPTARFYPMGHGHSTSPFVCLWEACGSRAIIGR